MGKGYDGFREIAEKLFDEIRNDVVVQKGDVDCDASVDLIDEREDVHLAGRDSKDSSGLEGCMFDRDQTITSASGSTEKKERKIKREKEKKREKGPLSSMYLKRSSMREGTRVSGDSRDISTERSVS